jgi:hypothetical protein
MFRMNSSFLAEFSRKTGIKDQRVEQLIAGYDCPTYFWDNPNPVTTTANNSEPAPVLSIEALKEHLDIIERQKYYPFYDKPYHTINFNFRRWSGILNKWLFDDMVLRPPIFPSAWDVEPDWWKPTMFEDREEVDVRELYEKEVTLDDLLDDGWTPIED